VEKKLFNELLESLSQAKAISKGKTKPSRRFTVESTDVKAIRE
jgi:putative transcriptional regulator